MEQATAKTQNPTHNFAVFGADIFTPSMTAIALNILNNRGVLDGIDYNRPIELPKSIVEQYRKICSRLKTIDRYKTRDQRTFTREQKRLKTLFGWIEKLATETREYTWNLIYQTILEKTKTKKINLNTNDLWEEFSLAYHQKPKSKNQPTTSR